MSRPKPPRSSPVGPLAGWELVRLARRGQSHRARLLLLYILTLAFVGFAAFWFTDKTHSVPLDDLFLGGTAARLDPRAAVEFGETFALVVLLANLGVVAAITPAYAAAAVAEEKDRKTLQLLMTTGLSDREIVLGKAAARAGFVLAVVFAGTPVLMITSLFGGVDFAFLVCGYLLIVGTTVLATAVGIYAACVAPDFRSAIPSAYAQTLVWVCGAFCCSVPSPFYVLYHLHGETGPLPLVVAPGYAALQCLLAAYFLRLAARSLRYEEQPPPLKSDFPLPPVISAPPAHTQRPRVALPKLDAKRPVLWKERCQTLPWADSRHAVGTGIACVAGLLVVCGTATLVVREWNKSDPVEAARVARLFPEPPDAGGQLLMAGGVLALGVYLVPLAVGVAGVIARERERQTLDSLLSVPLGRQEILLAKLRAYAERAWPLGVVAVVAVGVAFLAEGGAWLGLATGTAALAGVGFVVGLGTWLSVRCPGSLRAFRLLLPAVVLVVGWPVGVWNAIDWARAGPWAWGCGSAAAGFGLAGLACWRRAVGELERGG